MNRDIFQKQYDFELEQRNSLASATNIPIVSLTVLGGALTATVIGFKYSNNALTYIFVGLIILAVVSMLVSLYKVFRIFLGYSYQKIPTANQLKVHFIELKNWHKSQGCPEDEYHKSASADFDEYFDERLSEAAEHNSQII